MWFFKSWGKHEKWVRWPHFLLFFWKKLVELSRKAYFLWCPDISWEFYEGVGVVKFSLPYDCRVYTSSQHVTVSYQSKGALNYYTSTRQWARLPKCMLKRKMTGIVSKVIRWGTITSEWCVYKSVQLVFIHSLIKFFIGRSLRRLRYVREILHIAVNILLPTALAILSLYNSRN